MKKITLLAFVILIGLVGCKKEEEVSFNKDETNTPAIVGTKWKPVDADFDEFIKHMLVYDGEILLSYLDFVDGSASFSGDYNGNSISRHTLSQNGFGFDKFKLLNNKIYGMGSVGVYGAWKYDKEGYNKWSPFSNNGTNYYDLDYLGSELIIASSKSPYIHKGTEVLGDGFNGAVRHLLHYKGSLIAVGGFSSSGSDEVYGVARWNGTKWQKLGGGIDGSVFTATVYNEKLVVGGKFKNADGNICNNIAIWDDASWSALDGGFGGEYDAVFSLLANGSELIVGGNFDEAGDVYSPYIIKWSGTDWVKLPTNVPSSVGAMTIYKNRLYVANASSIDNNYFLRLE